MVFNLVVLCVLLLVSLSINEAFLPSNSLVRTARTNSVLYSKRDTKEEKRVRNRINAKRFGERGEERKKVVREEKRLRIGEQEQQFIEKCFVVTNDEDYPEYNEFADFFDELLF